MVGGLLCSCVENALGLRKYFEARGDIEFIVTSDKEGENSVFDQHLKDAEVRPTAGPLDC